MLKAIVLAGADIDGGDTEFWGFTNAGAGVTDDEFCIFLKS